MGWWLGSPVQRSDRSSRRRSHVGVPPRLVLSCEFQSTCLALRSPAIKTGNPPPKKVVRSAPFSGRVGKNYEASCVLSYPAISLLSTSFLHTKTYPSLTVQLKL